MEWLPEFSLSYTELQQVDASNMVALMRAAARSIYKSEKFQLRGEFGELFLHAAIRQIFDSVPAISKIYYKTARNDTVKGFDAVHVVAAERGLELWLGETKFYKSIDRAIRDVATELRDHTERDYLRDEFIAITNKIPPEWPHAHELKQLLDPNQSLDTIFNRVCIPVLLAYDSPCISSHTADCKQYREDFDKEVRANYQKFCSQPIPENVFIHLFLLPLETKKELIALLDAKLKVWQQL